MKSRYKNNFKWYPSGMLEDLLEGNYTIVQHIRLYGRQNMENKLTDRSVTDIANILGVSRQAVYNKFIHHSAPITVKELAILKDKLDYPTYDLLIEDIKNLFKVR